MTNCENPSADGYEGRQCESIFGPGPSTTRSAPFGSREGAEIGRLAVNFDMAAANVGNTLFDLGNEIAAVERHFLREQIVQQQLLAQFGGKVRVGPERGNQCVELSIAQSGTIVQVT